MTGERSNLQNSEIRSICLADGGVKHVDAELHDAWKGLQLSTELVLSLSLFLLWTNWDLHILFLHWCGRPPDSLSGKDASLSHVPGLRKKRNFCGRVVLILQRTSAEVPSGAAEEQPKEKEKTERNWQM